MPALRWIEGRFLRSRIARRVYFVVLASALLPISLFAAITWRTTSQQLAEDAQVRLDRDAKRAGMGAIERLLLLDAALAAPQSPRGEAFLAGKLRRVSGGEAALTGALDAGALGRAQGTGRALRRLRIRPHPRPRAGRRCAPHPRRRARRHRAARPRPRGGLRGAARPLTKRSRPAPPAAETARRVPAGGPALDVLRTAARAAISKKARTPLALDLRELDGVCDYFFICSGSSEVQVKAIAEAVEEGLKEHGVRPWHQVWQTITRLGPPNTSGPA